MAQHALDLKKHHQIHGRQGAEMVVMQNGKLFTSRGEPLGTDLERIHQKGFAVTGPLRQEMTRQSTLKKLQEDSRRVRAEMEAQIAREQAALEAEIKRLDEAIVNDELPPMEPLPVEVKVAPLGLLPIERKAAEDNAHYDKLNEELEEEDEPVEQLLDDEAAEPEETPEQAVEKFKSTRRKRV